MEARIVFNETKNEFNLLDRLGNVIDIVILYPEMFLGDIKESSALIDPDSKAYKDYSYRVAEYIEDGFAIHTADGIISYTLAY